MRRTSPWGFNATRSCLFLYGVILAATLGCGCFLRAQMKNNLTGIVYSDVFLKHDPGPENPETAERLRAVVRGLRQAGLRDKLVPIKPLPAKISQIERVHNPAHIERVRAACGHAPANLDWDTTVSSDSYDVALLAAGGAIAASDAVMAGRVNNAFCAVRPPGHHATADRAMGFCLFNNAAIAARHCQDAHGITRVLIVDWDAHHGNGTQEIFYTDPSVLYFSTHQFPCYPGSGRAEERGAGAGEGFTINVPMRAGSGDAEYLKAFREILVPAADRFRPEFVLISAGFDAHAGDPLTQLGVSTKGFADMTAVVKKIAEQHAGGKLVSILEGGYDLKNLSDSVVAHVGVLRGDRPQHGKE